MCSVKIKISILIGIAALTVPVGPIRAAFNPPAQAPPGGNVEVPVYSVGSDQTLSGGLSVTSGGLSSTAASGVAITGSSVGFGLQGTVTSDSAGGDAGIYAYAFGSDADDYAAVFYGGLGLQIASGDIYFTSRDSGISWPRVSDEAALYGIRVTEAGVLELRGHGAGINLMDQNLNSRFTISEAGVVNVVAGGSLQVNSVTVCLSDGTNCPAAAASGWTDDGAAVRLSTIGDEVGIGTIS
ncbi:MAG: hypothetical protein U1C18_01565, partial [Patescibacteria group bacterium]|nr:hypothetical protein [Patescibacteria group bacterium]